MLIGNKFWYPHAVHIEYIQVSGKWAHTLALIIHNSHHFREYLHLKNAIFNLRSAGAHRQMQSPHYNVISLACFCHTHIHAHYWTFNFITPYVAANDGQ